MSLLHLEAMACLEQQRARTGRVARGLVHARASRHERRSDSRLTLGVTPFAPANGLDAVIGRGNAEGLRRV
jgi:hypothetical protein